MEIVRRILPLFAALALAAGQERVIESVVPALAYGARYSSTVTLHNLSDRAVVVDVEAHRASGALVAIIGHPEITVRLSPNERSSYKLAIEEETESAWVKVRERVPSPRLSPVVAITGETECVIGNQLRSAGRWVVYPTLSPWFSGDVTDLPGGLLSLINTSEHAAKVALRTQQILAYETGVANTVDPLGGSYFIEALTDAIEEKAGAYFRQIEALGGVISAIEQGFFQREIANAAYAYQRDLDAKRKIIVGQNEFRDEDEQTSISILEIHPEVAQRQSKRNADVKAARSSVDVQHAIEGLRQAAVDGSNLMPRLLDCARSFVTLGEMSSTLSEVFGVYEESGTF